MVDLGSYLLGAVQLALVVVPLAFSAYQLRQRLLPSWSGAPARLVESITFVALLIWISEILGTFGLFYAGTLIAAAVLLGLAIWFMPRGGSPAVTGPAGRGCSWPPCSVAGSSCSPSPLASSFRRFARRSAARRLFTKTIVEVWAWTRRRSSG